MATVTEAMAIGLQRQQVGDLGGAESIFRQVLQVDPNHAEALHNLGIIAFQMGALDLAIEHLQRCLAVAPFDEKVHCHLGVAYQTVGRLSDAIASIRRALQLRPDFPEALSNLGNALAEDGNAEEAAASCQRALALRPGYAQALNNLAVALQAQGKLDEAAVQCREALRLRPDYAEIHNTLGTVLFLQGKYQEAFGLYEQAVRLRPNDAKSLCNLGAVFLMQGKLDDAETQLRAALAHRPDFAGALLNLGGVMLQRGSLAEALSCYREALRAIPTYAAAHSNLLLCMNYDPYVTGEELLDAHQKWGAIQASIPRLGIAESHDRDPQRTLRVGYVSPDLRSHTVAAFLEPILAHHDRQRVEAICYADVTASDAKTSKLMTLAHGWRSIHGLSDDDAAKLIRADRIDILVDLAGHTASNRLLIFARKPAPVQVSYLGYPCTTGLAEMDFVLTDAVADPPGEAPLYTEELLRLPRGFCCYEPPALAPEPTPSPVSKNGFITFGSFHHLGKLNEPLLDLWAEILRVLPTARLLIFRHTLQGRVRNELLRRLVDRGIEPRRIDMRHELEGEKSHLDVYRMVDISLDTTPWSGHTTACESLWMGVPVITLRGSRHAGRMVTSVLTQVGLADLVAGTAERYVELAVELAGDEDRLRAIRTGLREQVRKSSLCDGEAFTQTLEDAYREMWRRWCEK